MGSICCCCCCCRPTADKTADKKSKTTKSLKDGKQLLEPTDASDDKSKDIPEGQLVGKRFKIEKFINKGSFGRVYMGRHEKSGEKVAIKMEKRSSSKPQLPLEYSFFKKLNAIEGIGGNTKGIPKIYYFGPCIEWNALVMQLLGPNLEKVHQNCGLKFTIKTILLLAKQLLEIFEYFHARGLIYRDTKPENFLFGPSGSAMYSTVHIIDLGLCKDYLDDSGVHIPYVTGKGVTGTARYMSINNHKGCEQSRRDDMEALGYMLVYFAKGELPWMGLKGAATTSEKYKKICKIKESTAPEHLCADLPKEFAIYLKTVKDLEFTEEPNYKQYLKMFDRLYTRSGFPKDNIYDFDVNHRLIS